MEWNRSSGKECYSCCRTNLLLSQKKIHQYGSGCKNRCSCPFRSFSCPRVDRASCVEVAVVLVRIHDVDGVHGSAVERSHTPSASASESVDQEVFSSRSTLLSHSPSPGGR